MWTQRHLANYVAGRVQKLFKESKNGVKPYVLRNKQNILERIFKSEAGSAFIKYKSAIRKTMNKLARAYYEEHKIQRKHAHTVSIHEVNEICIDMLNTGDKKENFQVKRQLINLSLYTLYFKIDMLVYIYMFFFVFSCR